MLNNIRNKINLVRTALTNLNNHPIGKAVLTIVLFLDLFILISIFEGLDDHTSQLATPNEYIPQYCRDIVIDEDWNESNRLVSTARIVSGYRSSYVYFNEKNRSQQVHPICVPLSKLLRSMENDIALSGNLSTLLRLREQTNEVKSELELTKGPYDTSLLEVIADQNNAKESTASLKKQTSVLTTKLNNLTNKEAALVSLLMKNQYVNGLFSVIDASSNENRNILLEELRNSNFWQPVKRLGMEIIFLLPLVIIFYLWNSRSITANKPYQKLVSSHLLVVVFIPVIFKVIELVYDILPKNLLRHVFELLASLKLVAIWHYAMMGAGIFAALALIYFMQQKLFSHGKLIQKRIVKGQCQNCGVHLPGGSNACSVCGFMQFKQCGHCSKNTYVHGTYCRECGVSD